jgi:phage anti-repressor protein
MFNFSTSVALAYNYRIAEYGFEKGKDYLLEKVQLNQKAKPCTNYHLTLDMAKELAMLERSEAGRYFRRYFIEKEKELVAMKRQTLISSPTELFKGLKPLRIGGRKLFPFREILGRLGYSKKAGVGGKLARYGQHFVLFGKVYYITEEYARHLAASKAVYDNRKVVASMQPALPIDFGSTENLLGHGNL